MGGAHAVGLQADGLHATLDGVAHAAAGLVAVEHAPGVFVGRALVMQAVPGGLLVEDDTQRHDEVARLLARATDDVVKVRQQLCGEALGDLLDTRKVRVHLADVIDLQPPPQSAQPSRRRPGPYL